jgi:hypothetical protein
MDAEGGSRTLLLPLVSLSRATPGDFVAMMQGGAVDHQRAVDAVAQVVDHILLHRISLTIPRVQLCERIDSTLDIRHAILFERPSSINTMTPNDVFENADRQQPPFPYLTRAFSALEAIDILMLCPSSKSCTRYVIRGSSKHDSPACLAEQTLMVSADSLRRNAYLY